MCGLAGFFSLADDVPNIGMVRNALALMAARGPDYEGLSSSCPGLILGHRRLSIIDRSESGNQPMRPSGCRFEVVFNGEIYNHNEIREQLGELSVSFDSRSDTEVIARAAERWGVEAMSGMLRGMYAIGLYDHGERVLHLLRDPVGKKPLFYISGSTYIAFASTLSSLVALLREPPEVSLRSVFQYLNNHYVQWPDSILYGVKKLEPGGALSFSRNGLSKVTAKRPTFMHPERTMRMQDCVERTHSLLKIAVQRRIENSDVPVGLMLSGGLDSSVIAAVASKHKRLMTYCVSHPDPARDESALSCEIANQIGSIHTVLPASAPTMDDVIQIIRGMCEPMADASILNVGGLASKAKEHVGVILTGDGGDEAFGGYEQFLGAYIGGKVWGGVPGGLASFIFESSKVMGRRIRLLRRLATAMDLASKQSLLGVGRRGFLSFGLVDELFDRDTFGELACMGPVEHESRILSEFSEESSAVRKVMELHWRTRFVDDYLMKVDNGTMAYGLEARSPLLDVDLLNFAFSIPDSVRFHGFQKKAVLREIARGLVPGKVLTQRKRGFVAPVSNWITDVWKKEVQERILSGVLVGRSILKKSAVEDVLVRHGRDHDFGYLIWSLFVFEVWVSEFLSGLRLANSALRFR